MRRRLLYLAGVLLFFGTIFGGPIVYKIVTIPPTCHDGIQNQGETSIDEGGPCALLDPHYLAPSAVLWARALKVRDGSYNAVAYIQNPNEKAGVASVAYSFRLYDANNVLIAERDGTTFIMPGGITPVFEPAISTGSRIATHAQFDLAQPLRWQVATNTQELINVSNKSVSNETLMPRVTADVRNDGLKTLLNVGFVATIFDAQGNAIASSATIVDRMAPSETEQVAFTWPSAFTSAVGRIDIIPTLPVQWLE